MRRTFRGLSPWSHTHAVQLINNACGKECNPWRISPSVLYIHLQKGSNARTVLWKLEKDSVSICLIIKKYSFYFVQVQPNDSAHSKASSVNHIVGVVFLFEKSKRKDGILVVGRNNSQLFEYMQMFSIAKTAATWKDAKNSCALELKPNQPKIRQERKKKNERRLRFYPKSVSILEHGIIAFLL